MWWDSTTRITIGTFNAENLFLRYKFFYEITPRKGETQDQAKKRIVKQEAKLQDLRENGGYIENIQATLEDKKEIKAGQTSHTAEVITANKPDVLAMQEIEDMEALRDFNSQYLHSFYDYGMLIDGNDPRKIDVALLSKYPLKYVRTNIFVPDPVTKKRLFSRDCLEVGLSLVEGADTVLTLFVNHFKSQLAKSKAEAKKALEKRGRQASWVASMLQQRYGQDLQTGDFVVLGDFNANFDADELQPLLQLPGLKNVVQTSPLEVPGQSAVSDEDRWTHYFGGDKSTSQLDYILLSPHLAGGSQSEKVVIEKRGLADYVKPYKGPRFKGVGPAGTEASDHCAVFTALNVGAS
ncbi:MAG: endonuclease/exonuclease/phosphatase family protein [Thaumarchaeota archaeon]|nr:endonuclease/exonuclease/phosphatase family protein [Nitrososphaerota archaeon]